MLVFAGSIAGCSAKSASAGVTSSISGKIAGAGAGVTVALGGQATASTTTDASGNYRFSELANGLYSVTPAATGYLFDPVSAAVTVASADVQQDFTAAPYAGETHGISGTVSGAVSAGVTITLSGPASASTVTDTSGNYHFDRLPNGTYKLVASRSGYFFTPASIAVVLSGLDFTGRNFTDIAAHYSISGAILGPTFPGVTVSLSGAAEATVSLDASGNYSFGSLASGSYTVTPISPGYRFTPPNYQFTLGDSGVVGADFTETGNTLAVLAGVAGGPDGYHGGEGTGYFDGTGAAARFNGPTGIAVDESGTLYVADTWNYVIRKITPLGVVSTWAGTAGQPGVADGTGTAARFYAPYGVAVDASENVYVGDNTNSEGINSTIRKITPAGVVTTFAGTPGEWGSDDGTGTAARFKWPYGVAVDVSGNVYVADSGNGAIRKIAPAGQVGVVSTWAVGLQGPYGVAVDGSGYVYVADTSAYTIAKVTPAGVVSTLAGTAGQSGSTDGVGAVARFDGPYGVAVDGSGNVYVADAYTIRRITPSGEVTTLIGVAGVTSTVPGPLPTTIDWPWGVVVGRNPVTQAETLYITTTTAVLALPL